MGDVNNNELVGTPKYFRELFSCGNFFTSSYKFEFSNYSSRKGLFCEFQGKQKKHLESYPLWTSIFNFNYHKINLNGVDKNYFDKGEILVGYAELKLHNRPNPFLNYFVRSALQTGIAHCQFLRFNVQTNIYYRFTKKISESGNENILVTERGASFGYNTLVSDMRSIPIMSKNGYPVVFDGTHSVQQPGGLGEKSGGQREFVEYLSRAAAAVWVAAIFLETHQDPDNATSDCPNMVPLNKLDVLINQIVEIDNLVKK